MIGDNDSVWDGVDRRASPRPPAPPQGADADTWRYITSQLESTNAKLVAIHIDMIGNKADLHRLQTAVEDLEKAFPKTDEGTRDYRGHYDHHDGLIKTSKRWAEIGTDVAKKVFGGVAWLVVVFVALAVWEKIKVSVGGKVVP